MPASPPRIGWTVALGATAALAALAVAPALLGPEAGGVVRAAFSGVCHQLVDRSPHLAGEPVALCHRCSGILGGLLLGLAAAPLIGRAALAALTDAAQGRWLVAAVLPTALDWALGVTGVWPNTPTSRVLTGALFGLTAGVVLAANLLTARRAYPSAHPLLT